MTEKNIDARKTSGMCQHGNFPNICMECKETPENIQQILTRYLEAGHINERSAETEETRRLEQVYISQFLLPLETLLNRSFKGIDGNDLRISDVLRRGLERYQAAENKLDASKEFVKGLLEVLSKFPVDDQCISPRVALETKGINCLTASAIAFVLLDGTKEQLGIRQVDYVNPYGHAAIVVTLEDGSIWFADPRNNLLADLTDHVTVSESEKLRVYMADKPIAHTAYQALPALLPARYAIVENHISLAGKVPTAVSGYTEESMPALTQAALAVNGQLLNFYNSSNEFKADKQRFGAQIELRNIGTMVGENVRMREDVIKNKENLRRFLLHETEDVGFEHATLEAAFKRYRDAQVERRNLERVSDEAYRQEVEKLIEQIN